MQQRRGAEHSLERDPIPSLEKYIIVHELVHLVEPNHTANFWSRPERAIPDYRERKRRLAEVGSRY
jgi:predicted metal-dependent hydrolase